MNASVGFKPLQRVFERVENDRNESDTALFHTLLYAGEMLAKLAVAGMVACVANDRDRHRYRHTHALVRADGMGTWAEELNGLLTGPSAQYLHGSAQEELRELTMRQTARGTWQYDAVEAMHRCLKVVYPEAEELPQRLYGRTWFDYFAQVRNKRAHGALTARQSSEASHELEKSIILFAANFKLFQRPWAHLFRNQSGKWRVTELTPEREVFRPLWSREDVSLVGDGVYVALGNDYLYVDLLETDADVSDFFLPNGGFNGNRFELLSYVTNDRRYRDAQPYMTPPGSLPGSTTEGGNVLGVVGEAFTNLPPRVTEYVEREELESEVGHLLKSPDRYPLVTLTGRGGIGKTSLALKVLYEIAREGVYDFIFWFSARDVDLLPQGPKPVRPNVVTEKDIAEEFARLLPPPHGVKAGEHFERSLGERHEEGPYLFVFDNFETVQKPEELFVWIDTHLRPPNKVLITTRYGGFRGDYPVRVEGMTEEEANQLLDATAQRLGIQEDLSESLRSRVLAEAGGHPYVIKMLVGEIAKHGPTKQLERLVASRDDVLTALFERTYKQLSPLERRVFLTLCSWRSVIPQLAIQAVLLRSAEEPLDILEAIEGLRVSSLIELAVSESDGQTFIRVPLAASVFGLSKLRVSPLKTQVEVDARLLHEFGAVQNTDIRHGITPRVKLFFSRIAERTRSDEAARREYLPMLEYIARQHPPAWLLLADMAEGSQSSTALAEAQTYVRNYLEHNQAADTQRRYGWIRLRRIAEARQDFLGQIHALAELATLPELSMEDVSRAAMSINALLYDHRQELDSDEKRILVKRVADAMQGRIHEADADDCSRLAWLYLHLGDQRAAKETTERGLRLDPHNQHCVNLAEHLGIL